MQEPARCQPTKSLMVSLILAILSACTGDAQPPLRVGGNAWTGYEPMYLADGSGYYDPAQIQLIDFASAVEVSRAYRNRVIDIAALTADEALAVMAAEPGKHKIILVSDFSSGADCILAQSRYTTMQALRGKRIGVESNALGAFVLLRALQLYGMTLEQIVPVPMPLDRHTAMFEDGSIDAVVTFEPNCSILLASGAQRVFGSEQIPGEIIDVILTRTDLLDARRTTLRHFAAGWFRALADLKNSPNGALQRIAVHERTSVDTVASALRGIDSVDRERNVILLRGGPDSIEPALSRLASVLAANRLLPNEVELRALLEPSIVEQLP